MKQNEGLRAIELLLQYECRSSFTCGGYAFVFTTYIKV